MKLEPLVAVHAHPDVVVIGTLPAAPAAAIDVVTCPIVTTHDGCVASFEHAPARSATAAERNADVASRIEVWRERMCFISPGF
jgi:hypothetical protein